MRLPSIKTISTNFPNISKEDVKKVRELLEKYYYTPIVCLKSINNLIEGSGLEYIADVEDDGINFNGVQYINTGDNYTSTFCYDYSSGRIFISCWEDVVVKNLKRFGD
jgi:anion-transporting  ArsA/GET3 family ATPase